MYIWCDIVTSMQKPRVSIVAALGKGRSLGKGNQLLWHIPDDLKRFKALTLGHPVIMGRKTFDSIAQTPGGPLPGRTNIVVTRDTSWSHDGALAAHSIEAALEQARAIDAQEVFVIGGAQIYEQALPFVDTLYLTLIEDTKDADTFFPAYESVFTKKVSEEAREWQGISYRFIDIERA